MSGNYLALVLSNTRHPLHFLVMFLITANIFDIILIVGKKLFAKGLLMSALGRKQTEFYDS